MISSRGISTFSIAAILLSSVILITPTVHVSADSSDVSECSASFSGTISEPFNADTMITINSITGDYNVEFDYAFAVGEEGTIRFLKSSASEPSLMTLVQGETISTILTSGETIQAGVMKLYHQDISDCEILVNPSNIPDSKKIVLSIVSITELEPSKFLVKAEIPDAGSAKDFTKLAIAYVTNSEASVSYNVRNVVIVEAPDNSSVFCGRNIKVFDNVINGTAKSDLINGTGLDDLIRGYGGDDVIDGKGGNDCLIGNGGDEIIHGGPGDDSIYGGEGADQIYGNNGDDVLYGNSGDDLLSGGTGNDYIAGKVGNDRIFGNDGNDKLFGNEGNDYLKGGNGDDIMFGGDGNDNLAGNAGNDRLSGQGDNDVIKGQRGDDGLNGGEGDDSLDGGRDKDLCYDAETNLTAGPTLNCEEDIIANFDRTRPNITISQPANGTQFIRQSVPEITFLVTGTTFDSESGINRVEVGLSDPHTFQTVRDYQLAMPLNQDDWSTWSYELTLENEGDYLIVAKAFDNEGNTNSSEAFVSNILNTNVTIAPNASIPGNPSFVPRLIIIGVGDTVTWTNNDTVSHIVTSGDPRIAEPDLKFKSAVLGPGGVFGHTFPDAGSYQYFCAIHPFMTGEVMVQ